MKFICFLIVLFVYSNGQETQEKVSVDTQQLLQTLGRGVQTIRSSISDDQQQRGATLHGRCSCEEELIELKRNFSDLLTAYASLCNEIRHISSHLQLHEHALKNLGIQIVNKDKLSHENEQHRHYTTSPQEEWKNLNRERDVDVKANSHESHQHVDISETSRQRVVTAQAKVRRTERVVNNGTHTIVYVTTQEERDGHLLPPETSVAINRNFPKEDETINSQQKIQHFGDEFQVRSRRSVPVDNPPQQVNKPTKTVIGDEYVEIVSHRPSENDVLPEEFKELPTDMPWKVEGQKPIPILRPELQTSKPDYNYDEFTRHERRDCSCNIDCATNGGNTNSYGCGELHKLPVASKAFKEKYGKWVKSLFDGQDASSVFLDKTSTDEMNEFNAYRHSGRSYSDHHHVPLQRSESGINSQNESRFARGKKSDLSLDNMEHVVTDAIFATCDMSPNRHIPLLLQEDVEGRVNMWQSKYGGPVFMQIKLRGLKTRLNNPRTRRESNIVPVRIPYNGSYINVPANHKSVHGFHVHEFGNLTKGCQSTGKHYNPKRLLHGGPMDIIRHVGDLGNIVSDDNGTVNTELEFQKVSLQGEHSILGRSLVVSVPVAVKRANVKPVQVHSHWDDHGRDPSNANSATNGNSGPKIACCVIEKVDRLPVHAFGETRRTASGRNE